ncbi:winged helix-turn-helix domain-containing protein [Alkaliphilus pronyensis]|uniref:Winged helix-turn-helix domain-containing protein n=1 Tax=Alkaliphilus pronyensis TaxID=1482732 RepID=A0A6I0F189_9FIRM|nr:winged helix-turn-helix domain-containing protein [Alkaliphilus pronyensis]
MAKLFKLRRPAYLFLNQRVECFTHDKISERVKEYLQQLKYQQRNQNIVTLSLNKCQLADYLGISRASLYRIFKELQEEEYLTLKGNKIIF